MPGESWELSPTGTVEVTVQKDGQSNTRSYPANTTVAAAVREMSAIYGLTSVLVEDEGGATISQSDGNKQLGEVGALNIVPKAQGATCR